MENISLSQSTGSRSKSSIYVEPRPQPAIEYMEFVWGTGKRFWQSTTLRASSGIPVQRSTGREELIGSTIPMPSFARRPSTMNSFFSPATIPQNSLAVQQLLQVSELHFYKFSTTSSLSCWKIRFKTQVSSCSHFLPEAMLWIKEVEMVDSVDDFKSSRSIEGPQFLSFQMLDARIASVLNKIIQNSYFKKKVSLEEQKAQKEDRFLRGRQIAFMIYHYFRVTGAHDTSS